MQEKLEIIKSLFFDCLEWYVHLIYFERMNSSSYTNYHFEIWKPKLCTIMTKFHVTIYVISSTILGNHKTHLLTIYVGSQFFPHPHKNGILLPKLFWPTVRKKCSKGQLISKCLFEKIVWTKIPTKNLIDSAQQV